MALLRSPFATVKRQSSSETAHLSEMLGCSKLGQYGVMSHNGTSRDYELITLDQEDVSESQCSAELPA